jgi:ATP-dependent helicase/DNAse subunit B
MAFSRARQILGCEVEEFHPEELTRSLAKDATEETPVYLAPPLPAGTELWLSQSKINTFALCPYRFYCTYRLKLRDKKDSTTSYADDGVFLHAVMEGFLRASLGEDNQMHFPPPEELETLVDAIIDRYVAEVCPMPKEWLDNRLLHLFARLRGIALLILRDLVEELRHSRFVPTYFEERIGSHRENGLPAVMIPLTDGSTVHLSGVIDRVDLYREGDAVYVRVVDYKTSEHRFDVSKVRSGEDIQLILYLHAMLSAAPGQYRSGGAEFLYTDTEDGIRRVVRSGLLVDDETVLDAADDTEKRSYTRSLKKFSTEELTALIEEMRAAVASIARRILDGEATKTPSEDACRYCPVADHCDRACRK